VVGVQGEAELLEVVLALAAGGGLADLLEAGRSRPMRIAMMAITTSNSISVNPRRVRARRTNGIT